MQGVTNGEVTTAITISCSGTAPQTTALVVTVNTCRTAPGFIIDFSMSGVDHQCHAPSGGGDGASLTVDSSACTGEVTLTGATLVPSAMISGAFESYMKGTLLQDGQSCTFEIQGPLYPGGTSFCPPPSTGRSDSGPDSGTDSGEDTGTDGREDGGPDGGEDGGT